MKRDRVTVTVYPKKDVLQENNTLIKKDENFDYVTYFEDVFNALITTINAASGNEKAQKEFKDNYYHYAMLLYDFYGEIVDLKKEDIPDGQS